MSLVFPGLKSKKFVKAKEHCDYLLVEERTGCDVKEPVTNRKEKEERQVCRL